ncbi:MULTISPECIES: DUF2277 domain-containing protein [unclassified Polaromonas]|jgi:hypothetical protein|uniref:DUF2277 domain-containing protein n=1 Tax=unclassified Polaromonas TaxID=2638319 RepID=UPI000BDD0CD0|nr:MULTISPECIES: DUF2277 domain-containing protein [unclassified Polaromonas]OYY36934.1 MAG: hypothetical protein B7Y60_08125 [Polaromonas sp. 35-63-35]OYZ20554.1 MAG: hypothetical protein B7Y28_07920 [Polaromonas sp. 16-63-31]OYZ78694.1 MAG: hypothetical protein B7Y09_10395 [Polaromonas sp. 24-63-21]OZA49794.1 MAG: hypothetical protein B7X88_15440 [Polaromonas sp. 17-63-33]OZA89037.1 MAG: hypothetical protein B7X65_05230 [Polaromonas sp. 39-63-25]
MCRNIKTLFNFEPPATELEIRDASLQFVRKLSGFSVPSKANEAAFERAVEEVAASARHLIGSLVTNAEPRNREVEAERARAVSDEVRSGSMMGQRAQIPAPSSTNTRALRGVITPLARKYMHQIGP